MESFVTSPEFALSLVDRLAAPLTGPYVHLDPIAETDADEMSAAILRSYQRRSDGTHRDSAMFSIVASEWPAVRERLDARLARGAR